MIRKASAKQAWFWHVLLAGAAIVGYQIVLPLSLRPIAYPAFTLLTVAMFAVGVRRNRPEQLWAFWMFGIGTLATGLGDVAYFVHEPIFGVEVPYPSVADVLYLSAYACWAAGIVILVRGRGARREIPGWIDTAIAIVAFGLVEFVFLIYPYFTSPDEPLVARVVSAAYPLADLLIIGALARLLISPGSKTMSFRFLVFGFLALFASDSVYGVLAMAGNYFEGSLVDAGWMVAYALFAATALHPSVRTLAKRVPDRAEGLSHLRLVSLAACALIAPALFAHTADQELSFPIAAAISIGAAALFLLVIVRMAGLVRDLARSARKLEDAQALRGKLLRQTLRASEDERIRLAGELHDGPVQRLTALSYRVEAVRRRIARSEAPGNDELASLQGALCEEIGEVRRMMSALRPGALVERGLEAILGDHAAQLVRGTDIELDISCDLTERPTTEIETVLYRVAQEALGNAVKHGKPRLISLVLRRDNGSVDLQISDDGAGFLMESGTGDGRLGLATLLEYAEMAGGTLDVTSALGEGTTIHAKIPTGA